MTNTPHDSLFKTTFEDPEHAAGLLRDVLPAAISAAIVWDSIARKDGSFVDPELAKRHTDLLFSVRLDSGCEALLYLLLEHQSSSERDMPLRVLVYEVRIWERFRKEHPDAPLPAIIPVVLSHDPLGWRTPRSFDDMLDPSVLAIPELAGLVPRFSLLIDDLADQSNADLKARTMSAFVKLVLWALRDARHADQFQDHSGEWIAPFAEARRAPRGIDALAHLIRYFALVTEPAPFDAFCAKIVKQLSATKEIEMTMTWFEHHKEQALIQGRVEGRVEGRAEGRAETLCKLLVLKFGAIDAETDARIQAATPETLDRYLERILTATTLAAVFAE